MSSTYDALRDRALSQVSCLNQTDAQTIAQIALEEAMKFVAFHVRIPSLLGKATATQAATTDPAEESNAIEIFATGFSLTADGATDYLCPDRLYVKKDSSTVGFGLPYEFVEYHEFHDLKAAIGGMRGSLYIPETLDERPSHAFTVTPDDKIWATPLETDNEITLIYRKTPAAYSGSASPEINPRFEHILVNGAVLCLKEWLREPDKIITYWQLFNINLIDDVKEYQALQRGGRRRTQLKLHRSYRIR